MSSPSTSVSKSLKDETGYNGALEATRKSPVKAPLVQRKTKRKVTKRKVKSKPADVIFPPRVGIVHLPPELLEYIAILLTDAPGPLWTAAQTFLASGCSSFCVTRFNLSTLSRVCSTLRQPVERVLYRDIHLDFLGYTGASKNSEWPCATLPLLLRTLTTRPDVGRLVRSVKFDWIGDIMFSLHGRKIPEFQEGVKVLMDRCPKITTLFCDNLPLQIPSFKADNIHTLVTDAQDVSEVLKRCAALKHLYVHSIPDINWAATPHALVSVCLAGLKQNNAHNYVTKAIEMCGTSVQHLQVALPSATKSSQDLQSTAALPTIPAGAGANLRSLTFGGIHILAHPTCGIAKLLKTLPRLADLEFSDIGHPVLDVSAFDALPASIRSLTIAFDGRDGKFSDFVFALGKCLEWGMSKTERVVTKVEVYGEGVFEEAQGLRHVHKACEGRAIAFARTGLDQDMSHRVLIEFLVQVDES